MVIALAVMDTGFKRIRDLDKESTNLNQKINVVKLSVGNRFKELVSEGKDILGFLENQDGGNNVSDFVNNQLSSLGYEPDIIRLKKRVVTDLYKHKKYYLD